MDIIEGKHLNRRDFIKASLCSSVLLLPKTKHYELEESAVTYFNKYLTLIENRYVEIRLHGEFITRLVWVDAINYLYMNMGMMDTYNVSNLEGEPWKSDIKTRTFLCSEQPRIRTSSVIPISYSRIKQSDIEHYDTSFKAAYDNLIVRGC